MGDTFFSKFSERFLTRAALPFWIILFVDSCIVAVSGYLGIYLTLGGGALIANFRHLTLGLLVSLVCYIVMFGLFHTYRSMLRFSSFIDLFKISLANTLACILILVLSYLLGGIGVTKVAMPQLGAILVMLICSILLMSTVRVLVKLLFDNVSLTPGGTEKVFIYGVMEGGVSIAKGLRTQVPRKYTLAGFLSPDGKFAGQELMGVKVYNSSDEGVATIMNSAGASLLIISPLQTETFRDRQDLITRLTDGGIRMLVMQDGTAWDGISSLESNNLREVEIEDLLPRKPIRLDMTGISEMLRDRRILVTGAAGSIGSEIVRQLCNFRPSELILIDQAETPMHDMRLMLSKNFPFIKSCTIVASITSKERMEEIFARHLPEFVFHAAAYKHVPMMEDNPATAIQNNVYGTRVIADLSVKYGVEKFVMVSTDKAVNPTNVMGCSKRICEIYCQSLDGEISRFIRSGEESLPESSLLYCLNPRPATRFVTTRFGNVLGSNGSVIPIFRDQIKRGGPVTVTDPEIVRYFMTIPEACSLVLEASVLGKGGEIMVFDMGQPVKIADLAKRMIVLSGARNVTISYTGLRAGEKLYEELLSNKENTVPTPNPLIMVAKVRKYDYSEAISNEESLYTTSLGCDKMAIVRKMKDIVPEYVSRNSEYQVLDRKTK